MVVCCVCACTSMMLLCVVVLLFFFFFFQAEDGIRDLTVTGVQTCALPISGCGQEGCCDGATPLVSDEATARESRSFPRRRWGEADRERATPAPRDESCRSSCPPVPRCPAGCAFRRRG